MPYRSIAARISFGAFVVGFLIAIAASAGTRLGYWNYLTGFKILAPAVAVGLVALFAGLFWLASALRNNNSQGWRWGFAGLIGAAVLVWIPLSDARRAYEAPPIHDISTDTGFAPPFQALLALRRGSPNGPEYDGSKRVVLDGKITTVAELQKKAYPDIIAIRRLGVTVPKLYWHAFNVAKRMGWDIVAFDEKTGRIEATDTTFWFGFKDDIVIRVRQAGPIGARVDIRSKSRIGTSDYGRNALRIRDFLKEMS